MLKEKLEKLALEKSEPCVTVSLNTHRRHPENAQDAILLKNLLREARDRVSREFGKAEAQQLLEKIEEVERNTNINYHLDSLHIFLSRHTAEVIKSPLPAEANSVQIAGSFSLKPLIRMINQTEEYMIMLLSQSGVKLYRAVNNAIEGEIRNEDFPFDENPYYLTGHDKLSYAEKVDNMVRQFLNNVDKALYRLYSKNNLKCVVICTEDNFSRLRQVTDKEEMYYGYVRVNYNDTAEHTIAAQAWELVSGQLRKERALLVKEVRDAISGGLMTTDLSEIFRAAREGRADLLVADISYTQPALINGDSYELSSEGNKEGATDLISHIAAEILSKKGRVLFLAAEEMGDLGKIALRLRY